MDGVLRSGGHLSGLDVLHHGVLTDERRRILRQLLKMRMRGIETLLLLNHLLGGRLRCKVSVTEAIACVLRYLVG
jgi:hypothetical protein